MPSVGWSKTVWRVSRTANRVGVNKYRARRANTRTREMLAPNAQNVYCTTLYSISFSSTTRSSSSVVRHQHYNHSISNETQKSKKNTATTTHQQSRRYTQGKLLHQHSGSNMYIYVKSDSLVCDRTHGVATHKTLVRCSACMWRTLIQESKREEEETKNNISARTVFVNWNSLGWWRWHYVCGVYVCTILYALYTHKTPKTNIFAHRNVLCCCWLAGWLTGSRIILRQKWIIF